MLNNLIDLLGKENVKKLEDNITEIILNQIRIDIELCDTYILSPDDIVEFAEKCEEKAFANIESELIKKMENDMRKSLSLMSGKQTSISLQKRRE